MANTVGGPFGGLLNNPDLWERLLQSMGSIGRFLSGPPGPSLGANALRDISQIGVTAPLGVPGAIGLSAFGEGMRPPWEQSTLRVPERGLETASDLSKLALRDPMMLQRIATSALLGGPSAFSQAFHEHPVLTPLMAIPFLSPRDMGLLRLAKEQRLTHGAYDAPGGKELTQALHGLLDKIFPTSIQAGPHQETAIGLREMLRGAINNLYETISLKQLAQNPKHGQIVTSGGKQFAFNAPLGEWEPLQRSYDLELASRRIAAREKRVKRKLTQHEVEDVIAQAMSEAQPAKPYPLTSLQKMSDERLRDWYDNWKYKTYISSLRDSPAAHGRMKAHLSSIEAELKQRGIDPGAPPSQNTQLSREELLHQFEEGPPGPLPPIRVGTEGPLAPPPRLMGPITAGELDYYAQQGNYSRAEHSSNPFEPRVSGVHKLSNKNLLAKFNELSSNTHDMLKSNILPGGIHTFRNLEYLAELEKRGLVPKDSPITSDLLRSILKARGGLEGKQDLPPGIFTSPEQIGGQMLRGELGPPSELGLSKPVEEQPPASMMDALRASMGVRLPWQERVQQLLDNEWRRVPKTGPMSGPIDVRFGTNFLNTYAGAEPVGTKFSYKGQDFMRLKRGWSFIPRGEGPTTAGELSKQVTGGSDLLGQVPLEPKKQNWQQSVVRRLNERPPDATVYEVPGQNATEFWENGQRFVKGPKGWMIDPHMFIPPIQHIQGQTLLPHPEGAIARYIKENVWDRYWITDRWMRTGGTPQSKPDVVHIDMALRHLTQITGNPRVAQFWLMQHIHERSLQGKATPAEIVWFELQRGQRPPDEGMAGAKR